MFYLLENGIDRVLLEDGSGCLLLDARRRGGNANFDGGLHVGGLEIYANTAEAVAAGLTAGDFYRTGGDPDHVCVVS